MLVEDLYMSRILVLQCRLARIKRLLKIIVISYSNACGRKRGERCSALTRALSEFSMHLTTEGETPRTNNIMQ
jgi:hypothetical protein